ncbi:MAG: DNA polymerase I [Thermodesulfovibrionia bacterium]|nr:DNA polymerase I [Thermodesulfovibrionia bacterium]
MPTLYLIDGNSYIYRAFYAIKGLSNASGFPTNAIFGFTNMLLKVLREKKPDYFAIVFDSPVPTERHKAYEAYKAHRPAMPDELKLQIQPIKEIINAFNISNIEIEGYEADDVLGTIAKKAEKEGLDVYIITSDKDINQILSPKIKTYDTMKDKITEEKDVVERFGVEPSRFPEIIALMGDASDNIPGVHGIGEKTAVSLLKEFGSIDNIIQNHSRIKKPKLKEAISENIENIKLSLKLATIDTNVPLEISIEEFKPKEPDRTKLLDFLRKFEFSSLLRLIPEGENTFSHDAKYIIILDKDTFESAVASIKNEVAIDTETTSKLPMIAELVGISFSIEPEKAYYIPLAHSYPGMPKQLSKEYVLGKLKMILENPEIKKTGHNIKYDLIVLKNEIINLKGIAFDTMLASYLLNPNKTNHNLEDVSMTYLSIKKLSFNDITDKGKKNFREVSIEDATKYSGEDAAVTLKLKYILETEIEKEGLAKLFCDIEMPLIEVLADIEIAGIKIDLPLMEGFSKELEKELAGIEKRIYFLSGEEFNINSPKQLQEILFEKLGLRTLKKTKTGFSTDVGVLEELALEHELPKEILEHRTLSKLKNTYVDALPRLINPHTGRLHTSFNQTVTATGRLSSSDPNLQNIPIRGEWGKRIREAFISENGCLLLSSDYSQIELRVLAHLSQDEGFIEIFKNDGDIHTRTACELFGITPENVTSEMRRRAKTVNFGIVYGISPYGLSQQLGIHPEEAKFYIDTYFMRHSGVKNYINTKINKAAETGYVSTIFQRKRAIPELKSTNKNIRQLGERLAMNTPIQGSAADIIKIAMINIWRRLKKEGLRTKMLLQVHDELLFEVPIKEKDKVQSLVREEMENAVKLDVPLKVDIGVGKNWSEAH